MCHERRRTRDLLVEYDASIMPPRPRAAGLEMVYFWSNDMLKNGNPDVPMPDGTDANIVYPWETTNLSILSQQLFQIAANSGYTGTLNEFKQYFGFYLENNKQEIVFDIYENFPEEGQQDLLYFDLQNKILYHWNNGYEPVNAMLIANTILNGGEA